MGMAWYMDMGLTLGLTTHAVACVCAGMDDASYNSIFKPVVQKVMAHFQPGAVVLCCGADSLSGDRVGCWNGMWKGSRLGWD